MLYLIHFVLFFRKFTGQKHYKIIGPIPVYNSELKHMKQ